MTRWSKYMDLLIKKTKGLKSTREDLQDQIRNIKEQQKRVLNAQNEELAQLRAKTKDQTKELQNVKQQLNGQTEELVNLRYKQKGYKKDISDGKDRIRELTESRVRIKPHQ